MGGTFNEFENPDSWRRALCRDALQCGASRRQHCDHRHDPADDRSFRFDWQAGKGRGRTLYSTTWRYGRGQEDRAHRQGRHRRGRRHQAPRRGAGRQRSCERADGLRLDAARAGRGAGRDRGEGPGDRHRRRNCDDHREIALYRAHLVHPAAGFRPDGRLGAQERDQEGRHHRDRLRPRRRRREVVQRHVREGRRHGDAEDFECR